MYEAPGQQHPTLDCKGIEIVRRDTCALVAKTYEKMLHVLFRRRDVSLVRAYLVRQWSKIMADRITLQDYVFAKEVKFGAYARENTLPPAAVVASRMMMEDVRATPRYGERVPYVVVCGEPRARLVDLVVPPHDVLRQPHKFRLNAKYYITKQIIPALARALNLVGAGVNLARWFQDMHRPAPRRFRASLRPGAGDVRAGRVTGAAAAGLNITTIDRYYLSEHCELCGALCRDLLCDACRAQPHRTGAILAQRFRVAEQRLQGLVALCRDCTNLSDGVAASACTSLSCRFFYDRCKAWRTTKHMFEVLKKAELLPEPAAADEGVPGEPQGDVDETVDVGEEEAGVVVQEEAALVGVPVAGVDGSVAPAPAPAPAPVPAPASASASVSAPAEHAAAPQRSVPVARPPPRPDQSYAKAPVLDMAFSQLDMSPP